MDSRRLARIAVANLIRTNISTYQVVYAEQVRKFTQSPVCMVYSDATQLYADTMSGGYERRHSLLVSMIWQWGTGVEDSLDNLSQATMKLLADNQQTSDWSFLGIDQAPSIMGYLEIANIIYRRETFKIWVE